MENRTTATIAEADRLVIFRAPVRGSDSLLVFGAPGDARAASAGSSASGN